MTREEVGRPRGQACWAHLQLGGDRGPASLLAHLLRPFFPTCSVRPSQRSFSELQPSVTLVPQKRVQKACGP